MGREVRMVPADWEHPRNNNGSYIPLYDNYEKALETFRRDIEKMGLDKAMEEHDGGPRPSRYMHPKGDRTHYMMYENTSEGTPISPAFTTPEKLAHWLADTGASSFARMTATYEQWLVTIKRGSAVSTVYSLRTGLVSGVEGMAE